MRTLIPAVLLVLCAASAVAIDCTEDPSSTTPPTPIVINFGNGGYRLTGAESPVTFDFYAPGKPVRMGWTAAESDAAFLCLDRDYSGTIDSGMELFGNATRLSDGTRARHGFAALAEFDVNHDSVIDERDPVWTELLLWRDLNHDAVSQLDEIARLEDSGVTAIELEYHWSGRVDGSGNAFRYQSTVWIGEAGKRATPRPVYDIYFVRVL